MNALLNLIKYIIATWSIPVREQFHVNVNKDGMVIYIPAIKHWASGLTEKIKSKWRSFKSSMWPIPLAVVFGTVLGFTIFVINEPSTSVSSRVFEKDFEVS